MTNFFIILAFLTAIFLQSRLVTSLTSTSQSPKEEESNLAEDTTELNDLHKVNSNLPHHSKIHIVENRGEFGAEYNGVVDNVTKYIWHFNYSRDSKIGREIFDTSKFHRLLSLRVSSEVDENGKIMLPVEFEVRHFHKISQWTLPNKLKSGRYYRALNKSLCFQQIYDEEEKETLEFDQFPEESKIVHVTVSTSLKIPIAFKLKVALELDNLIANFDEPRQIEVSKTSPVNFRVAAPAAVTSRYALLYITSLIDEGCLSVTLQSPFCPIGEDDSEIRLKGVHQTMSQLAAITIKMEDLEQGRFLTLVMHENDSECDSINENLERQASLPTNFNNKTVGSSQPLFKTVEIVLKEKIDDDVYLLASCGILMFLTAFCVVFGTLYWKFLRVQPYPVDTKDGQIEHCPPTNLDGAQVNGREDDDVQFSYCCFLFMIPETHHNCEDSYLHDSCKKCSKDIAKSAKRYIGTFSIVAAFYCLPVYQFVHFYQLVVTKPGNEDLCYYNYLCLHPLGDLKDFNHIFSNSAYIFLGVLFLVIVYLEDCDRRHKNDIQQRFLHEHGIHSHFGIPYSMGAALVMEGILSGMYHVCPNHLSFQFDMSFMYVIGVLCMVKVYQARHPDTNASACLAFASLAVMVVLGVAATVVPSSYLWIMTTVIHCTVVLGCSVHVYSWGNWKFDWKILSVTQIKARLVSLCHPFTSKHKWMMVILVAANVLNLITAGGGFLMYFKFGDVSSHLLLIVLVNLTMYSVIYFIYKMKHKERLLFPTKLYFAVSIPIWVVAVYTFAHWSSNWQYSPATSRKLNTDCFVLKFYDMHDVWHFLSAFGMFFMFMFFFTLDDDLKLVKKTEIAVF